MISPSHAGHVAAGLHEQARHAWMEELTAWASKFTAQWIRRLVASIPASDSDTDTQSSRVGAASADDESFNPERALNLQLTLMIGTQAAGLQTEPSGSILLLHDRATPALPSPFARVLRLFGECLSLHVKTRRSPARHGPPRLLDLGLAACPCCRPAEWCAGRQPTPRMTARAQGQEQVLGFRAVPMQHSPSAIHRWASAERQVAWTGANATGGGESVEAKRRSSVEPVLTTDMASAPATTTKRPVNTGTSGPM